MGYMLPAVLSSSSCKASCRVRFGDQAVAIETTAQGSQTKPQLSEKPAMPYRTLYYRYGSHFASHCRCPPPRAGSTCTEKSKSWRAVGTIGKKGTSYIAILYRCSCCCCCCFRCCCCCPLPHYSTMLASCQRLAYSINESCTAVDLVGNTVRALAPALALAPHSGMV